VGSGEGVEITDLSGSGREVMLRTWDVVSRYFPDANLVTEKLQAPGKLAVTTPIEEIEQNPLEVLLKRYPPVPSPPPYVRVVEVPIINEVSLEVRVTGVGMGTNTP
jgi:hypothetical protein